MLNEKQKLKSQLTALLALFLTFLLLLWGLELFITSLYFHSLLEKIAGSLLGISFWLCFYVFWIPKKAPEWSVTWSYRQEEYKRRKIVVHS